MEQVDYRSSLTESPTPPQFHTKQPLPVSGAGCATVALTYYSSFATLTDGKSSRRGKGLEGSS